MKQKTQWCDTTARDVRRLTLIGFNKRAVYNPFTFLVIVKLEIIFSIIIGMTNINHLPVYEHCTQHPGVFVNVIRNSFIRKPKFTKCRGISRHIIEMMDVNQMHVVVSKEGTFMLGDKRLMYVIFRQNTVLITQHKRRPYIT
jgi:hypothetical protein